MGGGSGETDRQPTIDDFIGQFIINLEQRAPHRSVVHAIATLHTLRELLNMDGFGTTYVIKDEQSLNAYQNMLEKNALTTEVPPKS